MLDAVLEFRERVCKIYQKFDFIIDLIFKFAVSYFVIITLNTVIGYNTRLTSNTVTLALSVLCAFTPAGVLALVCLLLTVAHVYTVNVVLAMFVALILLVLYCFFLRFTPKHAYYMIAMPVLTIFNIPYVVPIMAGITSTPVTIFPICCGIFFQYLINVTRSCVNITVDLEHLNTENLLALVNTIVDRLLANREMLYFMAVYAVVELVVFVIRKLKFSFSFEVSIAAGTIVTIVGHLLINKKYPLLTGVGPMVIFALNATFLVYIMYSFIRVLDYIKVENVQFEDDDYFYYVRAVPKFKSRLSTMKIRDTEAKSYFEQSLENEEYEDDPYTDPETGEVLQPEKLSKAFARKMKDLQKSAKEASKPKRVSKVVIEKPEADDTEADPEESEDFIATPNAESRERFNPEEDD